MKNPNGLILGTPGSGKSFSAKREITNAFLICPKDDIIICDPEGEYTPLVERLHGQVIKLSPTGKGYDGSPCYINQMDLNLDYSDNDNPLNLKSDFILSLCELIVGGKDGLVPVEKTIIDRCVRIVCYDIKKLGKQLNKIGMLVVQDQVWNRVTINRAAHKTTRYYVWGGSSPSTSFDCSGFVSWVINHSGWDAGKLGAQGLCNICTPVSSANVKPGDLVNLRYPRCRPCGHLRRQQYDDPLWRSDLLCELKFKLLAVPFLPLWALAVKESERYEPENHEAPWGAGEEQRQNLRSARPQPQAGKADS